ncbi:MAG: metal ABC transporter ATP-binding protein [Candidatus Omnitrophica bacterium]|nr:metal ABC transporter ATP-binding protein [Candidatus Omnitrophota bacterium]
MNENVIEIKNLYVKLRDMVVLEDINLSVKRNDFLGIIGPNGGGKTTLLKTMLGIIKPYKGDIKIMGETPEKGREYIGYVPQYVFFDLKFPITVWEVVLTGRLNRTKYFKNYSKEDKEISEAALKQVEMEKYKNKKIGELSGGERQRVFVARALVSHPQILLLDEPMANVDSPREKEFYELLKKLKEQEKMTIILVSHDIGIISAYVDKIACINRKLYFHDSKEIKMDELMAVYGCPVDMIAHGIPHRVLKEHD